MELVVVALELVVLKYLHLYDFLLVAIAVAYETQIENHAFLVLIFLNVEHLNHD